MIFNEQKIVSIIKPHILKCRPGDWEHANRVVRWIKELGMGRDDLNLLIIAGYIHDIGWRDLTSGEKLTFEELIKLEPQANINSEPYIIEVLKKLECNQVEVNKVLRLVSSADKHESENEDEEIIVDADQLSKLDINHLKDKFKKSEWIKMYDLWREDFGKCIKTEKGKRLYPELLISLEKSVHEIID